MRLDGKEQSGQNGDDFRSFSLVSLDEYDFIPQNILFLDGDEEQSGHAGDDDISKMAVQAVAQFRKSQKKMKYLLRHFKDKYKRIMIQNQKILINIFNSPHPMTEKQNTDFKKSLTISELLIEKLKNSFMV